MCLLFDRFDLPMCILRIIVAFTKFHFHNIFTSLTVGQCHQSLTTMQFDSSFGRVFLLFDSDWICFYFLLLQF